MSESPIDMRRTKSVWSALRAALPLLAISPGPVALLVGASLAAGAAEAVVFALAAEIAVALSSGAEVVHLRAAGLVHRASVAELLLVAFVVAVLRLGFQIANAYLPARLETNTLAHLQRTLAAGYLEASWAMQSQERDGHLLDLMMNQVSRVVLLVQALATGASASLVFCSLVVSAFVVGGLASLAIVVLAGGLFVSMRPLVRLVRRFSADYADAGRDLAAAIQETTFLAEEHRVFGTTVAAAGRLHRVIERVREALLRSHFGFQAVSGGYNGVVVLLLVAGLAGLHAMKVEAIGALGAVTLILVRAMAYGQQMQSAYTQVSDALPFVERVCAAEAGFRAARDVRGAELAGPPSELGLEGVSYAYGPRVVLNDVSIRVRGGSMVGIVGPSGAGKSTLVQILLGLRAPHTGRYTLDGIDFERFDAASWSKLVAYVPQDPKLLTGTVAENIAFLRDEIEREDVVRAAKLAHIHDEILAMPGGYDGMIGQRANAVSGGQRQRMCIARALASRPRVLVLDEPTSGLDVHSERAIQATLAGLKGQVTVFIVAHRLSTIADCDSLLVLRAGTVSAFGPAEQVLATEEFLAEGLGVERPLVTADGVE